MEYKSHFQTLFSLSPQLTDSLMKRRDVALRALVKLKRRGDSVEKKTAGKEAKTVVARMLGSKLSNKIKTRLDSIIKRRLINIIMKTKVTKTRNSIMHNHPIIAHRASNSNVDSSNNNNNPMDNSNNISNKDTVNKDQTYVRIVECQEMMASKQLVGNRMVVKLMQLMATTKAKGRMGKQLKMEMVTLLFS